jgi:predicted DNA-binding transcriptional regulator AlpA
VASSHNDALSRAKARAAEWRAQEREGTGRLDLTRLSPAKLIAMAERPELSPAELQALDEAWFLTFGEWLTERSGKSRGDADGDATSEPELPADDSMLSPKDVVRVTGLSLSTIKRRVADGTFPQPMRLSPRRIGWPAREVKAWLETVDLQRRKPRQ